MSTNKSSEHRDRSVSDTDQLQAAPIPRSDFTRSWSMLELHEIKVIHSLQDNISDILSDEDSPNFNGIDKHTSQGAKQADGEDDFFFYDDIEEKIQPSTTSTMVNGHTKKVHSITSHSLNVKNPKEEPSLVEEDLEIEEKIGMRKGMRRSMSLGNLFRNKRKSSYPVIDLDQSQHEGDVIHRCIGTILEDEELHQSQQDGLDFSYHDSKLSSLLLDESVSPDQEVHESQQDGLDFSNHDSKLSAIVLEQSLYPDHEVHQSQQDGLDFSNHDSKLSAIVLDPTLSPDTYCNDTKLKSHSVSTSKYTTTLPKKDLDSSRHTQRRYSHLLDDEEKSSIKLSSSQPPSESRPASRSSTMKKSFSMMNFNKNNHIDEPTLSSTGENIEDESSLLKKSTSMLNFNVDNHVELPQVYKHCGKKKPTKSILKNSVSKSESKEMKRVTSFSHLEIREYNLALGDNPGGRDGPPISLDWNYCPKSTIRVDIDRYEESRPPRRKRDEMYMPGSLRMWTLMKEMGYTLREIQDASNLAASVRKKREISIKYEKIHRMQYKVGKILRRSNS